MNGDDVPDIEAEVLACLVKLVKEQERWQPKNERGRPVVLAMVVSK